MLFRELLLHPACCVFAPLNKPRGGYTTPKPIRDRKRLERFSPGGFRRPAKRARSMRLLNNSGRSWVATGRESESYGNDRGRDPNHAGPGRHHGTAGGRDRERGQQPAGRRRRSRRRHSPGRRIVDHGRVSIDRRLPDRTGGPDRRGRPAGPARDSRRGTALGRRRSGEAELLASAYRVSLEVAAEHGAQTVAFPSISTGIYGFPIGPAAQIALRTVRDTAPAHGFDEVRFVLFSQADLGVYERALEALEVA